MKKIYQILFFVFSPGLFLTGLAANFVVTNTTDALAPAPALAGSLRYAINQSNLSAGPNTITFNIVPAGLNTISLLSGLPNITTPVTIDGTSQPGWAAGAPVINLSLTGGGNVLDLEAGSDGSVMKGLILSGGNRAIFMNNSNGNKISGNFIGLDPSGMLKGSVFASWSLVEINNCNNTTIGGNTPQDRNIISGAGEAGLRFGGTACTGTVILNNYIGTDKAGTAGPGNAQQGIIVGGNVNFSNSKIGGSTPDSLNIIAKNGQQGILFGGGSNVTSNLAVTGNYIGVDKSGNTLLANGFSGLELNNVNNAFVKNNVVATLANQNGVLLINSPGGILKGNMVGVGADKVTVIPSGGVGFQIINSNNPVVGGSLSGEGNIVSNCRASGINIENSLSPLLVNNTVLGNLQLGIRIFNDTNPVLRGNVAGNSGQDGIYIGNGSINAVVEGNMLGLLGDGITPAPNTGNGISIDNSLKATIGGNTTAQRNIISSNKGAGIRITKGSDNTVVSGNYIGVDATGLKPAGNSQNGVYNEANNVTVGGSSYGVRNIVSGNNSDGIAFATCTGGTIKGNFVGIDKNGSGNFFFGNTGAGILLRDAVGTTIGGPLPPEHNISSQNGFTGWVHGGLVAAGSDGIRVLGGSNLTIKGNWTGTDSTGLVKMGNSWGGISLNENFGSTIGGTAPGEFNIASGNLNEGIYIRNTLNTLAQNINVVGNYVGVGSDGKTPVGNEDYGINITTGSNISNNVSQNIIAYTGKAPSLPSSPSSGNGGTGIIIGGTSQYNLFTKNTIYCNLTATLLTGAGNENVKAPTLDYTDNVIAKGTAIPGNTVEVFGNPSASSCGCQGETYIGTTIADASGNWTLTHNLGTKSANLSASQTTALKSTSQFSPCCTPPKITSMPVTQTVCVGGTATFTGTGTGSVYKWIERKPGAAAFTPLTDGGVYSGTSTNTLTLTNIPKSMDKSEYRIVVYGCYPMDTSTINFTFLYLNKTKVTPNQTICSGQSATLTASGSSAYSWAASAALNTVLFTGNPYVVSPATTTTYVVTGTNGGCIDTAMATVIVSSTLPITIKPSPVTICQGASIVLTASGATAITWAADPTLTPSGTGGTSVRARPSVTTTYTVTGTAGLCLASGTITVSVIPFVKLKASPAQSFCGTPGAPVALSINDQPSVFSNYTWTTGTLTGTVAGTGKSIAVTPAGTTTYVVAATGVCNDSAQTTITITPLAKIKITPSQTLCTSKTVTLSVTSPPGSTTYTWTSGSLTGTPVTPNNPATSITVTPTASTTYFVSGTTNSCPDSAKTTVTIAPPVVVSLSPSPTAICPNGTSTITASGAGITSYAWTPLSSSLVLNADGSVAKASPAATSTYTVTGTTVQGCTGTNTIAINVNPVPVIAPPSSPFICTNTAINIPVNAPNAPNAIYTWTATGSAPALVFAATGSGSAITNNNLNVINTGTTTEVITYNITATDQCSGTATAKVTVYPVPDVQFSGDGPQCSGVATKILLKSTSSPVTFNWTASSVAPTTTGATSGSGTSISQVLVNSGVNSDVVTYTITSTATNPGATCASNPVRAQVTVNPVPVFTALTPYDICSGSDSAIALNPSIPLTTFSWTAVPSSNTMGATSSQGGFIPLKLITNDGLNGTVTYKVLAQLNTCPYSKDVLVTIHPLPKIKVTSRDSLNFCQGKSASLVANPPAAYTWNTGTRADSIKVFAAGSYFCTLKNVYGCKGVSNTLKVNTYQIPKAVAGLDSSAVCAGKLVQLGTAGIPGYTYKWRSKPAYFVSNLASPSISLQQNTLFLLEVSNSGCLAKDSIRIKIIDDANDIYLPNAFSPNNDGLNEVFQVKAFGLSKLEVAIFNRWGEQVYKWNDMEGSWDGKGQNGIVQQDVYVYTVNAYGVCTPGVIKRSGTVTVIK